MWIHIHSSGMGVVQWTGNWHSLWSNQHLHAVTSAKEEQWMGWIHDNLCSRRPSAQRLFIKLMKRFTVVMPQEIKRYATLIHKSNMSSDWEYNYYRGQLTPESQKNLFISQGQITTAARIYSWSTNKEATFYRNLTWQEEAWWTCGKHWSSRLMRTCMCLVPTTYQKQSVIRVDY